MSVAKSLKQPADELSGQQNLISKFDVPFHHSTHSSAELFKLQIYYPLQIIRLKNLIKCK